MVRAPNGAGCAVASSNVQQKDSEHSTKNNLFPSEKGSDEALKVVPSLQGVQTFHVWEDEQLIITSYKKFWPLDAL